MWTFIFYLIIIIGNSFGFRNILLLIILTAFHGKMSIRSNFCFLKTTFSPKLTYVCSVIINFQFWALLEIFFFVDTVYTRGLDRKFLDANFYGNFKLAKYQIVIILKNDF